jgi:UDP-N-acetylglucosamine pyrophosphorylase
VFSEPFLRRIRDVGLPHHVALKPVPTVDDAGAPTEVTGRKFETFVFDAIPLAKGFVAFLTERSEEFAPLKNAEGPNSPETVRAALLDRTRAWYERAGRPAPETPEDLELSPLAAYDYETFTRYLGKGRP